MEQLEPSREDLEGGESLSAETLLVLPTARSTCPQLSFAGCGLSERAGYL